MSIPALAQQIQSLAASAQRLRMLVGRPLPALDDELYLRPGPTGCTALSVDPGRRPQQGIIRPWSGADLRTWKQDLLKTLAERDQHPTRDTPLQALQSLLIRDAIRNLGWMTILAEACPERPRLRFLSDGLAFSDAAGKTVLDLLAVRYEDGLCTAVVIELKADRRLKRLTGQVSAGAALVAAERAAFEQLAAAHWGEPVRLAATAERWIVWPTAGEDRHGDHDPREAKCRADGVRLVTYGGRAGQDLQLQAAARIPA